MRRWWLCTMVILISAGLLLGQRIEILKGAEVEIQENGSRRGTLTYDAVIEGAAQIGPYYYEAKDPTQVTLILTLRVEGRNDKWKERMRVGIGPRHAAYHRLSFWKPTGNEVITLGDGDPPARLVFRCANPGTSNLRVPFAFLDTRSEDWRDAQQWLVPTGHNLIQIPHIRIKKAYNPDDVKPILADIADDLQALMKFARNEEYPAAERRDALTKIDELVRKDFNRLFYHNTDSATTREFIRIYEPYINQGYALIDENVRMARNHLLSTPDPKPLPPPPDPDPVINPLAEYYALLRARDTVGLRAYLNEKADRLTETQIAGTRDSIRCWSEADYQLLDDSGGRKLIQLVNFVRPAYYDIYKDWVDIDDEALRDRHQLNYKVLRPPSVELLVVDRVCANRRIRIALDNPMHATFVTDSLDGTYTFTFRGGTPPYHIGLYTDEAENLHWERTDIRESRFTVHRDSLQAAGLLGNYRAAAFSMGSSNPVTVAGGLVAVPQRSRPTWIVPLLIVLTVGGLALLILYILRTGKRGRTDIFSEA